MLQQSRNAESVIEMKGLEKSSSKIFSITSQEDSKESVIYRGFALSHHESKRISQRNILLSSIIGCSEENFGRQSQQGEGISSEILKRIGTDFFTRPIGETNPEIKEALKSRIRARLESLGEWEMSRVKVLNKHRDICFQISEFIKERIGNLEKQYRKLFREYQGKAERQRRMLKNSILDQKESVISEGGNDIISGFIFESHETEKEKMKKCGEVMKYIEEVVLEKLRKVQEDFIRKLRGFKEKFEVLSKRVDIENYKTDKQTKIFCALVSSFLHGEAVEDSLYVSELQFFEQVAVQTRAEKELGVFIGENLERIQGYEEERLKGFVEIIKEFYKEEGNEVVPASLGKADIRKSIDEIYSVESLLGKEEGEYLEIMYPEVSKAGYVELVDFLYNAVKCEENERSLLVLEESEGFIREIGKKEEKKWGNVCLTVDGYLLGYVANKETREFEVGFKMEIEKIGVKLCEGKSEEVRIRESYRSFWGKRWREYQVGFKSEGAKVRFVKGYLVFYQ